MVGSRLLHYDWPVVRAPKKFPNRQKFSEYRRGQIITARGNTLQDKGPDLYYFPVTPLHNIEFKPSKDSKEITELNLFNHIFTFFFK